MCRHKSKGRKHNCSSWHKALMEVYYEARNNQEARAEAYGYGYSAETAEFYTNIEPRLTFKFFLQNWRFYMSYEQEFAA